MRCSAPTVRPFVTEPSLGRQAPSACLPVSFEWLARRIQGLRGRVQSTLEGVPYVRDQDRYLWTLDNGPAMDAEADSAIAPVGYLARLLEHDRAGFVLATYPQPWQVSADATPLPPIRDQYGIGRGTVHLNDRPFRKLERFAAEHRIPYVSSVDDFRHAPDPPALFQTISIWSRNDLHAQVLASFLVRNTGEAPIVSTVVAEIRGDRERHPAESRAFWAAAPQLLHRCDGRRPHEMVPRC
jgi:hypothetical protein